MSYARGSANCCDYEWMKPNSTHTNFLYVVLQFRNMPNDFIKKSQRRWSHTQYQFGCHCYWVSNHNHYAAITINWIVMSLSTVCWYLNCCHWSNCSSDVCISCKRYVRQILLLCKLLKHMSFAVSEGKQAQWEAELEKELEQQRQEQRRSRAISQNVSHRSPQRRPYSWWWYWKLWILSWCA